MPLKKYKNKKECISKNTAEMISTGHPSDQAYAAANSFCSKAYSDKKHEKLQEIKELYANELQRIQSGVDDK